MKVEGMERQECKMKVRGQERQKSNKVQRKARDRLRWQAGGEADIREIRLASMWYLAGRRVGGREICTDGRWAGRRGNMQVRRGRRAQESKQTGREGKW